MVVPFLCAKHGARDGRRNQVFGGFGSPTSARVSWSSTQGMGDDAGQARSRSVLTGLDNHMITGAVPALLPAPDQDMTARHGSLHRIRTARFHTKPLVPPDPADQWPRPDPRQAADPRRLGRLPLNRCSRLFLNAIKATTTGG